jgi:hypothetical protein
VQEREVWGSGSFAGYVHDHVAKAIGQLDLKAQILLALIAGTLAFEFDRLAIWNLFERGLTADLSQQLQRGSPLAIETAVGLATVTLLVLAFIAAFTAVAPRVGSNKQSLIFFGGIAAHKDAADYAGKSAAVSDDDLVQAILIDAYALAGIARSKLFYSAWATGLYTLGLILLLGHMAAKLFAV